MTNEWFTADLHLGHARIIELCDRPFSDVDTMNESIIARWNAAVQPGDTVWVLGDVALGRLDDSLALVSRLAGRKILVPGNHDRCWPGHRRVRPADISRYVAVGFEIAAPQVEHPNGWLLCHLPPLGDSADTDRYATHRPTPAPGQPVVHGHVHTKWRVRGMCVNVGVDVWGYRPVHHDEITAQMQ